jgi:hypothetical protein
MEEFNNSHGEPGIESLQELVSPVSSTKLHVVLPDAAKGLYELPKPANKHLPKWYRKTEMHPYDDAPLKKSVRACMPFMEALTFGWIVPLPTDIAITRPGGNLKVEWIPEFFQAMGRHKKVQVGGDEFPHDGELIKFNLPYMLRTPAGVSTLCMPPLNRVETRFQALSGVVDTDEYMNAFNIPALMLDNEFTGRISAGTPIAQIIPFKRDSLVNESLTRVATDEEDEMRSRTKKAVQGVDAYYTESVWKPKKGSRETGGCPLGFGDSEE